MILATTASASTSSLLKVVLLQPILSLPTNLCSFCYCFSCRLYGLAIFPLGTAVLKFSEFSIIILHFKTNIVKAILAFIDNVFY